MQSHEFTQQFLANERQLELDAEAERIRLATMARGTAPSSWARLVRALRRSPRRAADVPAMSAALQPRDSV